MTLIDALKEVVGSANVLTDGDLSAYEVDWRKRWHGKALAVVRPGSTAEVAAVVKACKAHGTSLVPQGGNTGLVGGSGAPMRAGTPGADEPGLASIALTRHRREIDPLSDTMTVEAGVTLAAGRAGGGGRRVEAGCSR